MVEIQTWPSFHRPSLHGLQGLVNVADLLDHRFVYMLSRPRDELRELHDPHGSRNLSFMPQQQQRRNASHRKARRKLWCGIAVDLDQSHVGFEAACRLLKDWHHHPTWTAPGGPEVDQQRDVAVFRVLSKTRRVTQHKRTTLEQRPMASAALGGLAHSLARDPVRLIAMRADDLQTVWHFPSLRNWPQGNERRTTERLQQQVEDAK
jgi:hypothetical protein